jgi:hypothetical protein
VDFAILRAALSVVKVVRDIDVSLTDPNKEGECHCKCPKCQKERSFSLNINSNWFNYFAKGCTLKGGIFTQCISTYPAADSAASELSRIKTSKAIFLVSLFLLADRLFIYLKSTTAR